MSKERHLPQCKGFREKVNLDLAKQNVRKIGSEEQQQQVQEANHEGQKQLDGRDSSHIRQTRTNHRSSSKLEQSPGKKELERETDTEIQIESLTNNSRSQLNEKVAAAVPPSSGPTSEEETRLARIF